MKHTNSDPLAVFNQLYKEFDDIYHQYAKRHGISSAALWLLYSLYEGGSYTQREFCSEWHYPPQTINSALKNLEKQGFLTLDAIAGNQKNKQIVLTKRGQDVVEQVIAPLISAERGAFSELRPEEREMLLSLTGNYIALLQSKVNEI